MKRKMITKKLQKINFISAKLSSWFETNCLSILSFVIICNLIVLTFVQFLVSFLMNCSTLSFTFSILLCVYIIFFVESSILAWSCWILLILFWMISYLSLVMGRDASIFYITFWQATNSWWRTVWDSSKWDFSNSNELMNVSTISFIDSYIRIYIWLITNYWHLHLFVLKLIEIHSLFALSYIVFDSLSLFITFIVLFLDQTNKVRKIMNKCLWY